MKVDPSLFQIVFLWGLAIALAIFILMPAPAAIALLDRIAGRSRPWFGQWTRGDSTPRWPMSTIAPITIEGGIALFGWILGLILQAGWMNPAALTAMVPFAASARLVLFVLWFVVFWKIFILKTDWQAIRRR